MAELTTLARPYARAAFESAHEASALAAWSEALTLLAAISAETPVKSLVASPTLTAEKKSQSIVDICEGELNQTQQNFVRTLADNDRLPLLPEITVLFELYKANQEKSVDVTINTAFELDDEMTSKLASALKSKLQRDVQVSTAVDRSLIGGVVVRAGDIVIDGSVKGRLAKLAEAVSI